MGLHDLAKGPEGDPVAIGQAAALAPGEAGRAGLGMRDELRDNSALADTRLADHGDELDRARCDTLVEQALEEPQVDLPADVGAAARPGEIDAKAATRCRRAKDANRLGLALERRGRQLLVLEDRFRCGVGGNPDRDAELRGDRLDP